MKRTKLSLWMFLCISSVLVISCGRATINYALIKRTTGETLWQIDNPFLAHDIEIKDGKETVKNDVLFVNILLKNNWYRPISGKVKVEFYDQDDIEVDNPWGWHPILLESHQEEWLTFIAPKTEQQITKIKIMIRGIGKYSTPER